ncbi:MAG: CARDB domain-containing protein [Candidatus Latescibacterota bacterium]
MSHCPARAHDNARTTTRMTCLLLAALLPGLFLPRAAGGVVLAESRFSAGPEGWRIRGDSAAPEHRDQDGNPGGYLAYENLSYLEEWYWEAPGPFRGDLSQAYGGTLRFDLLNGFTPDVLAGEVVVLEGRGLTLECALPYIDEPEWTAVVIGLRASAGWRVQGTGEYATRAQLQGVLHALQAVLIEGGYSRGLDNVVVDTEPGDGRRWASRLLRASSEWPDLFGGAAPPEVEHYGSAEQALGPPALWPFSTSLIASWASVTEDEQREFLELEYEDPEPAAAVEIAEMQHPGAVDSVYLRDAQTRAWRVVWSGRAAPVADSESRLLTVEFAPTSYPVDAVRLALDSPAVPGYNEIDAVALVGTRTRLVQARFDLDARRLLQTGVLAPEQGGRLLVEVFAGAFAGATYLEDPEGDGIWSAQVPVESGTEVHYAFALALDDLRLFELNGDRGGRRHTPGGEGSSLALPLATFDDLPVPLPRPEPVAITTQMWRPDGGGAWYFGEEYLLRLDVADTDQPAVIAVVRHADAAGGELPAGIARLDPGTYWSVEVVPRAARARAALGIHWGPLGGVRAPGDLRVLHRAEGAAGWTVLAGQSLDEEAWISLPAGELRGDWVLGSTSEHNPLGATPPGAPERLFPPDGWVNVGDRPELTWEGAAGAYWYDVYLSADPELDPQSDLLLGRHPNGSFLAPGEGYQTRATYALPPTLVGTYHVLVVADGGEEQAESDEANLATADRQMAVRLPPLPDLRLAAAAAPAEGFSGHLLAVTWQVRNDGEAAAQAESWYDAVYLSADAVLDPGDPLLARFRHEGSLAPGQTYERAESVDVPQSSEGTGYLLVVADAADQVFEHAAEANNRAATEAVTLHLAPPPDLEVTRVVAPEAVTSGSQIEVAWTVTNRGAGAPFERRWSDRVYLARPDGSPLDSALVLATVATGGVLAQADALGRISQVLPAAAPGTYHLLVRTDIGNAIRETDEGNNARAAVPTQVELARLLVGTPVDTALFEGRPLYLAVDVPAEQTLKVSLASADRQAANELYLRYGGPPARSAFELGSSLPQADQDLVVPRTRAGTYYLLVRSGASPQDGQQVRLRADTLRFAVARVWPAQGGNVGQVTLRVEGGRLDPQTVPVLVSADGQDQRQAAWWRFLDPSALYATFDLQGARPGPYALRAVSRQYSIVEEDRTDTTRWRVQVDSVVTMLPGAFEVVAGGGARLETRLEVPASARLGSTFPLRLEVANLGNVDLPAPLVRIATGGQTPLAARLPLLSGTDRFLEVMVLGPEGRLDVLAPGQRATAEIYARAVALPASAFWLAGPRPDQPAPRGYLRDLLARGEAGPEGERVWQAFADLVGQTEEDYARALRGVVGTHRATASTAPA